MATGKVYYWLRLKKNFMTSDTVDFLMSQPEGANYVVLYQMLHLMSINTEGRLSRTIGDVIIPYDVKKIQRDTKWFTADTINVALSLFMSASSGTKRPLLKQFRRSVDNVHSLSTQLSIQR